MAGGHFLGWAEEADLVEQILGRRVRRLPMPPPVVRAIGRAVDWIKRWLPGFDYPLTHEAARILTEFVPCDSSQTVAELGVGFRPPRETLADTLRWLVESGEIPPRWAPRLVAQRPGPAPKEG
ncbi:MAG: hypothetical protein R3190_19575 [Thermoanaerobaculia bacterium]|nr:hypothetical protein [Thermoanaerobaculia bacterium]